MKENNYQSEELQVIKRAKTAKSLKIIKKFNFAEKSRDDLMI